MFIPYNKAEGLEKAIASLFRGLTGSNVFAGDILDAIKKKEKVRKINMPNWGVFIFINKGFLCGKKIAQFSLELLISWQIWRGE